MLSEVVAWHKLQNERVDKPQLDVSLSDWKQVEHIPARSSAYAGRAPWEAVLGFRSAMTYIWVYLHVAITRKLRCVVESGSCN